jgi:pimeloyl-ACP methyl ester carboxylesterase
MKAFAVRALGFITGLSLAFAFIASSATTASGATTSAKPEKKSDVSLRGPANERQVGFVEVGDHSLYVDYIKPAPGKPVIVLLNGLTYRLGCWDAFTRALDGDGYGILRYDMIGMGQTLLKEAPLVKPIPFDDQIVDLKNLLEALNINEPVHLVGLSYGGGVAIKFSADYPELVASAVLMAPYIAPLESQDNWIRLQIQQTRLLNPANPASFEELYDYFLRIIVFSTYPIAEPIVLENPFKLEATYRLAQGARTFDAAKFIDEMPAGKLHLVVARNDQYVENGIHDDYWEKLDPSARVSRLYIEGSEHKIPEAVPRFAADWVKRIVEGDPLISGDRTFVGTPWRHSAESGADKIENLGK